MVQFRQKVKQKPSSKAQKQHKNNKKINEFNKIIKNT